MITNLAPAKINLTLDVQPKVPGADFHKIETIYHLLDWGDTMTMEGADIFTIEGDFDCSLKDNLIYKAWQLTGHQTPVKVTVDKQIPVGGGLGGGSSNAATFLKMYGEFCKKDFITTELIEQAGGLGKDIPFFLSGHKCALGTGFGEIIKLLDFDFAGTPIYLYTSGQKSDTGTQYQALQNFDTNHTQEFLKQPDLKNCGNTFDQLRQPKIPTLHMCGSGSTLWSVEDLEMEGYQKIKTQLL